MNIALIHDWITNVSGAEKVLLSLKELYPQADIYTSVYMPNKAKVFNNYQIHTTYLNRYSIFRNKREALIPFAPLAFESLDLSKYDLVISNTTFAAKGVITKPDTVHLCYCHTPTRYLWSTDIDNRASKGKLSNFRQKISHKLKIWDYAAAQRPDYYLANSKTIQKRINKYYRRKSEVIYPPVDIAKFQLLPDEIDKNYYLFVSRLVDYKRADVVITAFKKNGLNLIVSGDGPLKKHLEKNAGENIKFVGRVSDGELIKLYQEAKAFIFAAEEDFGIVPVEAMACGKPVIAYNKGGASETVIEGKTGVFFEKQEPDAINNALKYFNKNLFDRKIIRARAEEFSENIFKKSFASYVDIIMEDKKRG